jgi:hypothetical protein
LGLRQIPHDPRQSFEIVAQQSVPKLDAPFGALREESHQIVEISYSERHGSRSG